MTALKPTTSPPLPLHPYTSKWLLGSPAIKVSLLARQISFLALMAATVGSKPAQPTMPVTTDCTTGGIKLLRYDGREYDKDKYTAKYIIIFHVNEPLRLPFLCNMQPRQETRMSTKAFNEECPNGVALNYRAACHVPYIFPRRSAPSPCLTRLETRLKAT